MMTLAEARLVQKIDGAPWDIDAYSKSAAMRPGKSASKN